MTETPERLVARLQSEGEKTLEFFRRLTPQQWELPVYSDGGCWSVRQILAHFVAAERGIAALIQNVLDGGEGAPADFDLNAYNERKVSQMEGESIPSLLEQFAAQRRASIQLVAHLSAQDLLRQGRHPWLGAATLEEIIQLLYRHNQIHQREIRKALSVE